MMSFPFQLNLFSTNYVIKDNFTSQDIVRAEGLATEKAHHFNLHEKPGEDTADMLA